MDNQSENKTGPREQRSTITWSVSVAVLALAIIGLAWYVYPRLQQQSAAIDALRGAQDAAEKAAPAPSNASGADAAQQHMRDQLATLESNFTKAEHTAAARVANVRKQAHQASEDAYQRAQALIDMQVHALETRLARVESSNTNADSQVAELKSEIGHMRQQMAQQGDELQSVRRQINTRATTETRQIADLKQREERDRKDVDSVEGSLAMHRVDFEVTEHHTSEPAPGIYLHIDRADPSFSNVDGWMRVMPQDRTFWMHRQNVAEPVIFYGANDKKQGELVVTAMRGNSVKGFLLMPEQQRSQIASAAPSR